MTNEQAIKVFNMIEAHGSLAIQAKKKAIEALQKEPCKDAISRETAINAVWNLNLETSYDNEKVEEMLKALPPVTPKQQTGYWISFKDHLGQHKIQCSCCHYKEPEYRSYTRDFCPSCGAKMEEDYVVEPESEEK